MDIIKNNYGVISFFDDVAEGSVSSKFLSKEEATLEAFKKNRNSGHLTLFRVVENVAIIGIIPVNGRLAYIFNKEVKCFNSEDKINITSGVYEDLMNCYVFRSTKISESYLNELKEDYFNRGGFVYSKYRSFEDLVLRPDREFRKEIYINDIIFNSIFKHGFREVRKKRWSNGEICIRQKQIQRLSVNYPSYLNHAEFEIQISKKMFLGSLFGKYYERINQLDENKFGVVCSERKLNKYNFAYFEVEF